MTALLIKGSIYAVWVSNTRQPCWLQFTFHFSYCQKCGDQIQCYKNAEFLTKKTLTSTQDFFYFFYCDRMVVEFTITYANSAYHH